jgi:proteasome alpha subunit
MTMPFYVSPEQIIADKAKFARTNIAKGRALVALECEDGIIVVAETFSRTLRKINEIYDRIIFAGVGKYNEYDQLRQGGVRWADVEGYRYSREDVHAKALANLYAQILGQTFTHDLKPMEVEILIAEVGWDTAGDELYRVTFDGLVVDEDKFCVLPVDAEAITDRLKETYQQGMNLADAFRVAVGALSGPERTLTAAELEAAILERHARRRSFRRLADDEMTGLLG